MANEKVAGKTPARVAAVATQKDAVATSGLVLLGVMGPATDARALVRLPGGRVKQIRPGERLAQGRVLGIDEEGMMLERGGKTLRITVPGN